MSFKIQDYISQATINKAADQVVSVGTGALLGYAVTWIFTSVNPLVGATVCAASVILTKIVRPIFNSIFDGPDANKASRILGKVFTVGLGVAIPIALTVIFGFPMTIGAGIALTLTMLALQESSANVEYTSYSARANVSFGI